MNALQKQTTQLIRHFIHGEALRADIGVVDWAGVFEILKEQRLIEAVYPYLMALPEGVGPSQELLQLWQKPVTIAVTAHYQIVESIKEIISLLNGKNIDVIMAKGLSIAQYYPYPAYRIMCDLDLLVHQVDFKRCCHMLLDMGYVKELVSSKHTCFRRPDGFLIEIHTDLYSSDINKNLNIHSWQSEVWRRSSIHLFGDTSIKIMSDEDLMIHEFLHFAMHFAHSGSEVRHLVDIGVIGKGHINQLDWHYISVKVVEIGIRDFASSVLHTLHEQFGIVVPDDYREASRIRSIDLVDLIYKGFPANEDYEGDRLMRRFIYRHAWVVTHQVFKPLILMAELMINVFYHHIEFGTAWRKAKKQLNRYHDCRQTLADIGLM